MNQPTPPQRECCEKCWKVKKFGRFEKGFCSLKSCPCHSKPPQTCQDGVDEFIRDVTKVTPMAKSEVRARLDKILESDREKARSEEKLRKFKKYSEMADRRAKVFVKEERQRILGIIEEQKEKGYEAATILESIKADLKIRPNY